MHGFVDLWEGSGFFEMVWQPGHILDVLDSPGVLGMNWRSKRVSSSNSDVPAAAGVYAIGHSDTLHDLEIGRTYVYVGETKNLQRRLSEHLPANEENPGLREYMVDNYGDATCWYARLDARRPGPFRTTSSSDCDRAST